MLLTPFVRLQLGRHVGLEARGATEIADGDAPSERRFETRRAEVVPRVAVDAGYELAL